MTQVGMAIEDQKIVLTALKMMAWMLQKLLAAHQCELHILSWRRSAFDQKSIDNNQKLRLVQ